MLLYIIVSFYCNNLFATIGLTASITNNRCYNGTTGTVTGIATGGSSAQYEYRLATGPAAGWQSSGTFSALAAGTYPLSARDKNNTSDITTIFVTVSQPTNITVSSNVTNTSCASSSDGIVSLTISGGTVPYSYTWTKNGNLITSATSKVLTNLTPGIYNAVVTDLNGCQQQLTNASSTAIVPLTLTGFNQDVVADGTNTSSTFNSAVTSAMDVVLTSGSTTTFKGSNFYVNNFKSSSSGSTYSSNGLPVSGSFYSESDATHPFIFEDYNASNALRLNGLANGTLTLANTSVAPYQNLYVLTTSCNGVSAVNYTVTYSDNTTTTGSFSVTDWASGTANKALSTLGRVFYAVTPGIYDNTSSGKNIFALYDLPISIAANNKNVSSIKFTNTTATSQANFFAITGSTSSVGVKVAAGSTSSVTPAVAIAASPLNLTYCNGESYTFMANPTNAGISPSYVWTVGGVTQASTGPTMTAAITGTGSKVVGVTLNVTDANATCLTSQTATKTVTLTSGSVTPAVTITGPSSMCQSTGTTYFASSINGGLTPTYAWYVNINLVSGATDSVFTNTFGASGANTVYAKITSSVSCAVTNPVTSNTISTSVSQTVTPSVTIAAKSSKSGTTTTAVFSISTSANLGASPSYQWYLNGNPISGATSNTYSVNNPISSDSYSLATTSSAACPNNAQVMSNYMNASSALPVTISKFNAALINTNTVSVAWVTATESNVKVFEVQKSQSQVANFVTIGLVTATNSSSGSSYRFLDTLSTNGDYFYRLKSVDFDGAYTYSDIASVTYKKGASTSLIIYPNPFSNTLNLQVSSTKNIQEANITLYNTAGQAVCNIPKGLYQGLQTINLQGLDNIPAGIYLLKVNGDIDGNNWIRVIKK